MFTYAVALQGRGNEDAVLNAIQLGASAGRFDRMRAAYAYATAGGVVLFADALRAAIPGWARVRKRWLVSIDWGHTDPEALDYLASLENSEVRVPYAADVLANGLIPRVCFHPKTLLLDQADRANTAPALLAVGSANLTVSGLRFGHEDLAVATWTRGRLSAAARHQLEEMQTQAAWIDRAWNDASRITTRQLAVYAQARKRRRARSEDENRRVRAFEGTLAIPLSRIAALRGAGGLWVEVARVVANRGPGLPGNQIDLAHGTRTFFGLDPKRVSPNSPLGTIQIKYGPRESTRNMRFGNNSMDKLDLPIPGVDGPPTYERSVLMFEREGERTFRLHVGTTAEARRWKRMSVATGLLVRMIGGREWGTL